jgi:hypothetical protein
MNKLAHFVDYYRNLGRQAALQQTEKTAGMMPRSRLGKAALGALGIGGGIAAAKALSQPEPSAMENLYEGGRDMLSNMSQEELMGYANMLSQLQGGGGGGGYSMGYSAGSPSPTDYTMQDLGEGYAQDPSSQMGYESQMTPEEMQQYMAYYS